VVLAYLDALNRADPDAVAALVSEDFVNEHTSARGQTLHGRVAYRARLDEFLATFPALNYDVEDIVAEGAKVVVAYRMTAHHAGAGGAGTRVPIDVRGVFRFVVAGDRITHRVDYRDGITVEQQLGLR
jgi:steroid delta-isomerase-like uncharacterized protein